MELEDEDESEEAEEERAVAAEFDEMVAAASAGDWDALGIDSPEADATTVPAPARFTPETLESFMREA